MLFSQCATRLLGEKNDLTIQRQLSKSNWYDKKMSLESSELLIHVFLPVLSCATVFHGEIKMYIIGKD